MIETAAALAEFAHRLEGAEEIGIDTEADSLHCYQEKLCLVQVSASGGLEALVDPLAGFSLAPLFEVFGRTRLIFHGADYDLRLLRRTGFEAPPWVFDTMIAARFIGSAAIGLAALIEKYFGVTLAKGSQKANWALRPLPAKMADYALNDTRYLLPLKAELERELHRLGRWEWFAQSCARAVASATRDKPRDLESAWQISGSGKMRGLTAAMLRGLWHWRDAEAAAVDRPAFHIMNSDELIAWAEAAGAGREINPRHLRGGRRERFLAAIQAVRALPESDWPKFAAPLRRRPTERALQDFRRYKELRDQVAAELQLDPALIASKSALETLANEPEATGAAMLPWQRALLKLPEPPASEPA